MSYFRLSFRASLHGLKFESGRFTKEAERKCARIVKDAAREWLREVIRVGVWRGFAKGSVIFARGSGGDLARYLGMFTAAETQIVPKSNKRPRNYFHDDGRKIPKWPSRAGVFGHYSFADTQHRFRFTFRSDVVYFALNDMFANAKMPSTPWHFLSNGATAFNEYVHAEIKRVFKDSLKEYLVKTLLYESDGEGGWTKYNG